MDLFELKTEVRIINLKLPDAVVESSLTFIRSY